MNRNRLTLLTACLLLSITPSLQAKVWTYEIPGRHTLTSPDYEVTVIQNGKAHKSFTYYSFPFDNYPLVRETGSIERNRDSYHKGPLRHSHSIFSFEGKVTVRIKVRPGAKHITLPLRSAKVLPSSYEIPCTIENGDTIVFTLDRPEKVAVVANYDQIWEKFVAMGAAHEPLTSWTDLSLVERRRKGGDAAAFSQRLGEGFDNPIIMSALPPETNVPDPEKWKTLFVEPGDRIHEKDLIAYDVVWFKPGIHDLSDVGHAPYFQTRIKRGQTVYIEGGAYIYGRFKRYHDKEAGPTTIMGRGIISGLQHAWIHSFSQASQLIDIDRVIGITITDRSAFSIYSARLIEDVTLLGAWHGNNDGPDYSDNTRIRNCFFLAHDDNLKINHRTDAKHVVIWQAPNAHSIMVKETYRSDDLMADSKVEDIDVITYFQDPSRRVEDWARYGMGAIASVTAMPLEIRNFVFKDIRIESPYLYRVFNINNMNTNKVNPGWFTTTRDDWHTRINGMRFENITVNSPLIAYRSLINSDYAGSLKNIRFKNIRINGVKLTKENFADFFEVTPGTEVEISIE